MADTPLLDRNLILKNNTGYNPQMANFDVSGLQHQSPNLSFSRNDKEASYSPLVALENKLANISNTGKLTGGSISRSLAEVSSDRFESFVPGDYDNEDAYAQGQGWPSKMVNGLGKGLSLTGTTFLQSTAGLINGIARSASDGRAASFYDNEFNRGLDEFNKKFENWLPNYYTKVEREANWYSSDNLLTGNFLWDGIVKNLGYAAGAALSGQVFAKAIAAIPLSSKLFSIGRAGEVVAATEEGLLAGEKAVSSYGKIKSLSDKYLSTYSNLNAGQRALVAGLATTGEAGFEAYHNLNEFRNQKIQEYKDSHMGYGPIGEDLEKINIESDGVGNSSFLLNTALLSATNYIQFPKILGSSYTLEKGIVNSTIRDIATDKTGKFIAKEASSKIGKVASKLDRIRPFLFSTSEGFEEGAQYAISVGTKDYYDKKYNNLDADWIDSLFEGVKTTLTTNEGMENILIGGLSGALMLGRGKYKQETQKTRDTASAIEALNKWNLSDFTKATVDSVNRGTAIQKEREDAIRQGDILTVKDKEVDYIVNYLTPRVKYGRFDLVVSDINDYKRLVSTDEGFSQLQAEGKALPTDTKQTYLQRLVNLENTANNIKSLYQSIQLRYSNIINNEGNPVFSNDIIDKMIYAATKVADYDKRIPELTTKLLTKGLNITPTLTGIVDKGLVSKEVAQDLNKQIKNLQSVEEDDLMQDLDDLVELSLRRKKFITEYNQLKNNPAKFKEKANEAQNSVSFFNKDESSEPIEIGREYKIEPKKLEVEKIDEESWGANGIVYPTEKQAQQVIDKINESFIPKSNLTVLKINDNNTLKVRDSEGLEFDIASSELEGYQKVFTQKEIEEQNLQKKKESLKILQNSLTKDVEINTDETGYEAEAKKPTAILAKATIGEGFSKSPYQVRANKFGNIFHTLPDRDKIKGIIVTQKTEKSIIPGLMDYLKSGKQEVDSSTTIAMVMVKTNQDGTYSLVDENGQVIPKTEKNLTDKAIFQVFPLDDLEMNYINDKGEKVTQSMFRKDTSEEEVSKIKGQYKTWRNKALKDTTIPQPQDIDASFGFLDFVKIVDQNGKETVNYEARTSVEDAQLLSEEFLEKEQAIKVATNNNSITNGSVTFKTPLGRVFLQPPGGLVKLLNAKIGKKRAETIYSVILQLSKNAQSETGVKNPKSEALFTWLRSIVYWGIPKNQAGFSSVWFQTEKVDNLFEKNRLFISGKGEGFDFLPSVIEDNKEAIISLLENLYHNTNATLVNKDWNKKYIEIKSINDKGELELEEWPNYQTYLLSSKGRSAEQIPLSTRVAPIKGTEKVNRNGIYFWLISTQAGEVVPKKPEVPKTEGQFVLDGKTENTYETKFGEFKFTIDSNGTIKVNTISGEQASKIIEKLGQEKGIETLSGFLLGQVKPLIDEQLGKKQEIVKSPKIVSDIESKKADIERRREEELEFNFGKSIELVASGRIPVIERQSIYSKKYTKGTTLANTQAAQKLVDDYKQINAKYDVELATLEQPKTTDTLKDWKNRPKTDKDRPNKTALREKILKENKFYLKENWEEVDKWLKSNFPNIPVYRVKNIIQATNGKQAWGMFQDGAIYLYENAEVGTVYHEVFEGVWKIFSSQEEQNNILNEFKNRKGSFVNAFTGQTTPYSEATNEDIKEQLAEEFRDYILNQKPKESKSFIAKLFSDLWNFIKDFFVTKDYTSELFEKIGTGYYKNYVPYETNLSFAKQGFIDIDQAISNTSSNYRIANIPATIVHEIMQQMTYNILTDLSKTNKSLFSIPELNRSNVYSKQYNELYDLIDWESRDVENMVLEGKISQEQADSILDKYGILWNNIDTQWTELTNTHEKEYLKQYNIEFDENDTLVYDDENKSGKEEYQDARKIDTFRKSNPAVKLLLATLAETSNGEIRPSTIGGVTLLPFDKVFITLKNLLHSSTDITVMMNRLRDFGQENPDYRALYKRLTKLDVSQSLNFNNLENDYDIQLLASFYKAMRGQNPDVKIVFISTNGDVTVGDAHLSDVVRDIKEDMQYSIIGAIRPGSNSFVKFDEKSKDYSATDKIKKLKLEGSNLESYRSFLETLGIEFDKDEINSLSGKRKSLFIDAVDGIKSSLEKIKNVGYLSKTTLDVDGRLRQLATIKATTTNPEFESTYFSLTGERHQTYIGTNLPSDLYDVISSIETKEDLQNTQFSYLLSDNFSQNSVILNKLFTGAKSDILKTGIAEGFVNDNSGKKKESSNLTAKERLIQEINLNLDNWYSQLVPGDASMEHIVKLTKFADLTYNYNDISNIFRGYFIDEINVSREERSIANVEGRKTTDLRFLKGIIGDKLNQEITTDNENIILSPENLYKKYKDRINKSVEKLIKDAAKARKNELFQYDIASYIEGELVIDDLNIESENEETLIHKLEELEANYIIANIELHKLVYSDPYFYKDELKRIKNYNSPAQPLMNSIEVNSSMNRIYNKGYEKGDLGYTDMNRPYFTSSVISDVFSDYKLEGYDPFEETDGEGIITFKAYRNFRIRSGAWNNNEEDQFKYDVVFEKEKKNIKLSKKEKAILEKGNPKIKSAYTPIKPIVRGNKQDGSSYNDIILDKFALVPFSYRILFEINPESNAIKHYNKMQKEDIDYTVYSTGRKVYTGQKTNLYNPDGSYNTLPFSEVNNIPFDIVYVQTEVPSKDTSEVTQGSQPTKLITMDFMNAGVPIDFKGKDWDTLTEAQKLEKSPLYKEIKHNEELLVERIKEGYYNLLRRLGIKEINDGYEIFDKDKLSSTLERQIFKQEINSNVVDAFNGFKQGDVVLEATPAYQKIRNVLYSLANKQVTRPTISGGLKVQVASTLLESKRIESRDVNGKKTFTSDILDFYKDEDGKRVCEVMVGRWFDSEMTDKELLDYLNNTEEGKKILEGVAYRIPTQKQNSIDAIRIKQFLPVEFGDSVIIPSALVKKVGSDFDIDKLSMYLKNVFLDLKGNPKLVPFLGYGQKAKDKLAKMYEEGDFLTEKQRNIVNKWISNRKEEDRIDTINQLATTIFGEESFEQEVIDDYLDSFSTKEFKDKIIDEIYRKSLENEYIQSMQNLISHPLNFKQLIKPNSADQLKGLAQEITELLGRKEIDYTSTSNLLNREFMNDLRQAFVRGKYAIGIAATSQTNNAQNQRATIYVDDLRLEEQSKDDQKWLGDAQIKFKEFNSVKIDGIEKATLSYPKNVNDEYISDIIGQFIDGYVDISKGPWIMQLGAYPNVVGTWLFLAKLGVPIDTIAYFMNQPIVRQYLSNLNNEGYTWLFNNNTREETEEIFKSKVKPEFKEIPSNRELKKMIGNQELNDTQKAQQLFILGEFFKYAKLAEHLFLVQQSTNFDTAGINDPFLAFKKELQIKRAKTIMISDVNELLDNSFVGYLRDTISKIRNAFSTILISDRKSQNELPSTREVLEKVLTPYVNTSDSKFVKIARKAVNDLFDWAVQNDPDLQLNTKIKSILLGSESEESAAQEIINFKNKVLKDKNHPLYNNFILKALRQESNGRPDAPQNIYLTGKNNKMYDQNQIIYGFNELKQEVSPELYNKIVYLSVLQSGLNNSKISFTSLLPYEDFKNIYNNSLSVIDKIPNLQDFSTLNVFERNNWGDSDIIPFMRPKIIKTKSGRYFNINMDSLSKNIENAVKAEKIPPVIHISISTKEGRGEFVTMQWENRRVSPKERRELRKKGITSHLTKALFRRVNDPLTGKPFIYISKSKGREYENYLYVAVNAWGDSYRANELYNEIRPSVINNGYKKIEKGKYIKTFELGKEKLEQEILTPEEVTDETILSVLEPNKKSISLENKIEKLKNSGELKIVCK